MNSVFLERNFNCGPEILFKWLTDPLLLIRWFGPEHLEVGQVESELVIGGPISFKLIKQDGSHFFIKGSYLEIEKSKSISFSFSYIGLNNSPPDSIVTLRLEALNAGTTRLTLVQKFELLPPDMEQRTRAWEAMLARLDREI